MVRAMTTETVQLKNDLGRMSRREWERLCDGCARCCLHKIEFEDTGEMMYTRIVCRYLDQQSCRCRAYAKRTRLVPSCHRLTPDNLTDVYFMPETCAYRLLAQGQELLPWHPLVSGESGSVHSAGMSVRGRVVSEEDVESEDWPEHVVDWVR
jgi:uncharacterized protein